MKSSPRSPSSWRNWNGNRPSANTLKKKSEIAAEQSQEVARIVRAAKLGCAFTQTALDQEGRPIRDPGSTTFTGAIEDAATFGNRIYAEAVRRGLFQAKRVIVLGDGAEWIKNLAQTHFLMATRIVDFYHAKEHVSQLCKALFTKPALIDSQRERWWDLLAQGDIEGIVEQATGHLPRDPAASKDARREIEYLNKN